MSEQDDRVDTAKSLVDITWDDDIGRPVRIKWTDSGMHHDAGWAKREEFFDGDLRVMDCESVGMWMGESERAVAVGQTRDEHNGNWMAAQVIWKPSIVSKEWLDGQ